MDIWESSEVNMIVVFVHVHILRKMKNNQEGVLVWLSNPCDGDDLRQKD